MGVSVLSCPEKWIFLKLAVIKKELPEEVTLETFGFQGSRDLQNHVDQSGRLHFVSSVPKNNPLVNDLPRNLILFKSFCSIFWFLSLSGESFFCWIELFPWWLWFCLLGSHALDLPPLPGTILLFHINFDVFLVLFPWLKTIVSPATLQMVWLPTDKSFEKWAKYTQHERNKNGHSQQGKWFKQDTDCMWINLWRNQSSWGWVQLGVWWKVQVER